MADEEYKRLTGHDRVAFCTPREQLAHSRSSIVGRTLGACTLLRAPSVRPWDSPARFEFFGLKSDWHCH